MGVKLDRLKELIQQIQTTDKYNLESAKKNHEEATELMNELREYMRADLTESEKALFTNAVTSLASVVGALENAQAHSKEHDDLNGLIHHLSAPVATSIEYMSESTLGGGGKTA